MAKVEDAQTHLRHWAELLEKLRPEVLFSMGRHELRCRLDHFDAMQKSMLATSHGPTARDLDKRAMVYLLSIPYSEYRRQMDATDERLDKVLKAPGMNEDRREQIRAVSATRVRLQKDYAYAASTAEAVAKDDAFKRAAIGAVDSPSPLSAADVERIFRAARERLADQHSTTSVRQPVTRTSQDGTTTYYREDRNS